MAVKDEEMDVDQEQLLDQQQQNEPADDDPQFQFMEEDEFEIVSEDEYEPEPEPDPNAELKQQLATMQEQLQMQQQQSNGQSNQQGFDQMAQILKQMQEQTGGSKEQDKPQIDFKKKRTEWQEGIWDKPVDILDDYTQTNIAPAFMQMQNELKQLKQQLAKQTTTSDPKFKRIMDKYGSEVEDMAKNFKDDPDAYKKAASMIGMQHFDDLLAEEREKFLAEQQEEAKKPKNVSYTGTDRQPNPTTKSKKKKVVLNSEEKREFERQFRLSPLPDKKSFYDRVWSKRQRKQ